MLQFITFCCLFYFSKATNSCIQQCLGEVTVESEVRIATEQINELNKNTSSQWSFKQKLTLGARILANEKHSYTLSGQLSCRDPNNDELMWSTPYHLAFELITPDDFVLLDFNVNIIGGKHFPNRAIRFHGHMYKVRDDVNCIIHTHPPFTSALSIIDQEFLVRHMDTMAFYQDIQWIDEWPGIPFGNDEGLMLENALKNNVTNQLYYTALLAHHGLIVMGKDIESVIYRAWFFELGAKMLMRGLAAVGGNDKYIHGVKHELAAEAARWRVSDPPVHAHFNNWALIELKKYQNRDLEPFFVKSEESNITLYEKLGGQDTVSIVVDAFYDIIVADDLVGRFFNKDNINKVKNHMKRFLTVALGGPNNYSGRSMRKAHEKPRSLGLNSSHFNRVVRILNTVLNQFEVSQTDIFTIMEVVGSVKPHVLGL